MPSLDGDNAWVWGIVDGRRVTRARAASPLDFGFGSGENGGKLTPLFHVEDTSIIASMPSPARHRHSSLTLLRQQAMI